MSDFFLLNVFQLGLIFNIFFQKKAGKYTFLCAWNLELNHEIGGKDWIFATKYL